MFNSFYRKLKLLIHNNKIKRPGGGGGPPGPPGGGGGPPGPPGGGGGPPGPPGPPEPPEVGELLFNPLVNGIHPGTVEASYPTGQIGVPTF